MISLSRWSAKQASVSHQVCPSGSWPKLRFASATSQASCREPGNRQSRRSATSYLRLDASIWPGRSESARGQGRRGGWRSRKGRGRSAGGGRAGSRRRRRWRSGKSRETLDSGCELRVDGSRRRGGRCWLGQVTKVTNGGDSRSEAGGRRLGLGLWSRSRKAKARSNPRVLPHP